MIGEDHFASPDVQQCLEELEQARVQVEMSWEERKTLLAQCFDLQVFQEYMEQAESWLASKEAFITQEDTGVSIHCLVSDAGL